MKKAFVSSVYLGILAACSQGTPPTSPQNTTYPTATVGASVSSIETNPFFQGMYASFEQVGKEQGSLKIFVDSASNNQEKQDAQLQDMVKRGAKALVVNLADVKQGGAFVKRLCQEKIPVVYINRNPGDKDLASCESAYFVDGDAAQAGVLQGLQVLKGWKEHTDWDKNHDGVIQYAMIEGIPGHAGAMARTKWSVSTMEFYPNLGTPVAKVLQDTAMFQTTMAEELLEKWIRLPEFQNVEVILSNNDSMALGAISSLKKHNIKLPVFSIDGSKASLDAVKQGDMAGTVFNDYDAQARTAVRIAANLAANTKPLDGIEYDMEYKVVKVPYQDINKDNFDAFYQKINK